MPISAPKWDQVASFLDKNISLICSNNLIDNGLNHCAHFVSHALGISSDYTCAKQTGMNNDPASIRVHEVFARCESVGKWAVRPSVLMSCLIFITNESNVDIKKKTMVNVPRKHIGIYINGKVYHYSNTKDKVIEVSDTTFKNHYSAPSNDMFYGQLPLLIT